MNRRCALLIVAGLVALGPVADAQTFSLTDEERAWIDDHPVIRVAPAPNFPPMEYFDDQGIYRGVMADYAKILETRLGIKFEIAQYDAWQDVVTATKAREVDVWMEAQDTPERREFLNITPPYVHLPVVIIVRREMKGTLELSDLSGLKVAVIEGYESAKFVRDNHPDLELIPVPSIEVGLERVSFGAADALVASIGGASYYIERNGITNLRVAGTSGFEWHLCLAVRSDWPELFDLMQRALDSIDFSQRQEIYRRWVSLEADAHDVWGVPQWVFWVAGLALLLITALLILRRSGTTTATDLRTGMLSTLPLYIVGTAVIVVIMTGNWWADRLITVRMKNDTGDVLQTVLRTTSEAVFQFFNEREEEALVWAGHEDVWSACRALESSLSPDSPIHSSLEVQLESLLEQRGYLGFLMLKPDGTVLASNDGRMVGQRATSAGINSLLKKVLASPRRAGVSLPQWESGEAEEGDEKRVTMMLAAAAPDMGDGVPCVLTLLMDPQREFSEILQRGRMGESGESYAFNGDGLLISESRFEEELRQIGMIGKGQTGILSVEIRDPGGSLISGHQPDRPRAEQPLTLMALSATSGHTDVNFDGYNDYRGVPVIGAWTWDEATGFGITTEINVDEAYASLFWVHRMLQGGTILIVLLVATLMVAFTLHNIRRRRIEAQLNRQSAALEAAADGITITSADGTILWVNPAFSSLTGYSFDEAVGGNPRILKSEVHGPEFYQDMWQIILAGDVWSGEIVNRRKDGSTYTEEQSITPVLNSAGVIVDFVALKRDITERKSMEAELERARKRMEDELNVGREIQMSMLPLTFPAFPERKEFVVHAALSPAREVGGDFYDFFFVDDDHFCVVVGDVAGKGVPSALFMAVTKTLIKSRAVTGDSTADIITQVNNELSQDNKESMFVTVFIGILDVRDGQFTYTNAGHNPPLLKRTDDSVERLDQRHGPVIGAVDGLTYSEDRLTIEPDDLLLMYTDGVTEAFNEQGELFTESRLVEFLRLSRAESAESHVQATVDEVSVFQGNAEQADDITLLSLHYRGSALGRTTRHTISLTGEPESVGRSILKFDAFAQQQKLSGPVVRKIKIALDDLLNNIVSYGYPDAPSRGIDILLQIANQRLSITVIDDGIPFNPLDHKPPRIDESLEDRQIGGLGLHLVRSLADNISYRRENEKNVLMIVFDLSRKEGESETN